MNTSSENQISFRLPDDHLRELRRLAALRGVSKGRLAKDFVTAAIVDCSRFDELSHRLRESERALEFLVKRSDEVADLRRTIDELRASLATVTTRLLVETGRVPLDDAVAWTQEAFQVSELT